MIDAEGRRREDRRSRDSEIFNTLKLIAEEYRESMSKLPMALRKARDRCKKL
jgi:hypothetical protein